MIDYEVTLTLRVDESALALVPDAYDREMIVNDMIVAAVYDLDQATMIEVNSERVKDNG